VSGTFGLDTVISLHKSRTSLSFESISCVIGLTTIAFDCCPFGSPVCRPYLIQHNAVLCGPLQWKHDRFLKLQSSVNPHGPFPLLGFFGFAVGLGPFAAVFFVIAKTDVSPLDL
ncbi:unnamed protein product, partial [Onchocerca ochengi]